MKYYQDYLLKDGRTCCLRNGTANDGQAALDNFLLTHAETDYLLSYPDENRMDAEQESLYLKGKEESENEIEIVAVVDGTIVGTAGISAVGARYKVRHRAEFGISVAKDYWGLGIGKLLTAACVECARKAGFIQLELEVVADNERAVAMYRKAGFAEYGRNPKGFYSRLTGFQEIVSMRMEL